MGGFLSNLFGEPSSVEVVNNMTPEQQKLLSSLSTSLLNTLFNTGASSATPSGTTSATGATPATSATISDILNSASGEPVRWSTLNQAGLTTPQSDASVDASTTLTGIPGYSGDMTAGASGLQTQTFDYLSSILGGNDSANNALTNFLNKYSGGYTTKAFDPTSTLDLFQSSVYDPAMKSFNEETLPQIAELFAGRNSFDSGSTQYTMTKSAEDLMADLMGTKASMLSEAKNAWDTNETSKFNSINSLLSGAASTLTNDQLAAVSSALSAGDTQQSLNQADINELITKWTQEQPYNNPYLSLLQIALGTNATDTVSSGGTTGLLSSLLPGMGYGGGAYLMNYLLS